MTSGVTLGVTLGDSFISGFQKSKIQVRLLFLPSELEIAERKDPFRHAVPWANRNVGKLA